MRSHCSAPPRPPGRLLSAAALVVLGAVTGCDGLTDPAPPPPKAPHTVVLFATPKFVADFADPTGDVARFMDHYAPLTTRADETIVIYAVGNSEHILQYRGRDGWDDAVEWARHIGFRGPVSDRRMDYHHIDAVVRAFRAEAAARGLSLLVFDQIDQGREFAYTNFKDNRHPECLDRAREDAFDIRVPMRADGFAYATAPDGIAEGTLCGHFLADQVGAYVHDLDFDGILYGNQLGTRGHWLPENGPGWTDAEAAAILDFLERTDRVLGDRRLMWFDSYNNLRVERDSFSFPPDGYRHFDYLIAAGFCVITTTERYRDNLESKLTLPPPTRILASLDYVDPWYEYDSMTDFPEESRRLEDVAIANRHRIDGVVFFANDEHGQLVPRRILEAYAERFWEE